MKKLLFFLLVSWSSVSYGQKPPRPLDVGEAPADSTEVFETCTKPPYTHYHFMPYEGGVKAIHSFVNKQYMPVPTDQSGYLTIRCLLNCKNRTGRFTTLSVNLDYQSCTFDAKIVEQLIAISKQLPHWKAQRYNNDQIAEGYVSIIYKIKKGAVEYVLW